MKPVALLLLAPGCASAVWNARNVDCSDARWLFIEAEELELSSAKPDPGDACTIALRGLRGSDIERDDNVLEIYGTGEIDLLFKRDRPLTEVGWTRGADIDVVLDELSVQLDTRVGSRGNGGALWQTDEDALDVWFDTPEHLDQLQITSRADVTLTLPAGSYRLELEGASADPGGLVSDPAGPLVLVRTQGAITVVVP